MAVIRLGFHIGIGDALPVVKDRYLGDFGGNGPRVRSEEELNHNLKVELGFHGEVRRRLAFELVLFPKRADGKHKGDYEDDFESYGEAGNAADAYTKRDGGRKG